MPKKFDLKYIDSDGKEKYVVCIHRAPLGTHERFIGFLIEHYAGAFPVWLSPVQVALLTVSDKHLNYAKEVEKKLLDLSAQAGNKIRVELKNENETLGKKIREAEMQKIPYLLIVGDKEIEAKTVSVRERGKGDLGAMSLEKFVEKVKQEIAKKVG
jgi:threonyl-tRNA synthetase